jgi:oligoribonuclease (3'-5' exoribonuclease)
MSAKKMTALLCLLMGCAGAVQASGINGDYKGDPIVRVLTEGKELQAEDVPAVIHDGRTVVPLYLLKQAGVYVQWDQSNYQVQLSFPDPSRNFTSILQTINAKLKEYDARNARIVFDEQGPYLQIDLQMAGDSNRNNDRIIALAGFLRDVNLDMLVVYTIHNNQVMNVTSVQRSDAELFLNKKLPEHEFIKKWKSITVTSMTDVSSLNLRPEPAATAPFSPNKAQAACNEIMASYVIQNQREVNTYNAGGANRDPSGFQQHLQKLKESTNSLLKEVGCPPVE